MRDTLIEEARNFAIKAHGHQKYGDSPYVVHLDAVAGTLERFGHAGDTNLIAAAYLHDTLEDTEYDIDDSLLQDDLAGVHKTPLEEGIRETAAIFARLKQAGTLDLKDLETYIHQVFGFDVLDLVSLVTNARKEFYPFRHQRNHATFTRLHGKTRATALKLADRISNVFAGWLEDNPKRNMYRNEQKQFFDLLYVPGDSNGKMWSALTQLLNLPNLKGW